MSKSFNFNLGELLDVPDYLSKLLNEFIQKENNRWYEEKNNTLLSGMFELDEKYSNSNTILRVKFMDGFLKESTYFYPTGEVLCSEIWAEDGGLVLSEQFHLNQIASKIEEYKDGVIISSKEFNESGEMEEEYSYKKKDLRDIADTPNDFTTSLLVKTWLEKGWEE